MYGGSIERLAGAMRLDKPPHRVTVWRWINNPSGPFPKHADAILALAGALDLDPMALWDMEDDEFRRRVHTFAVAIVRRRWKDQDRTFMFLEQMLDCAGEWPADRLARHYYRRPWVVRNVSHDARRQRNYYGHFLIAPETLSERAPQLWHFAFRDAPARGIRGMNGWYVYGSVEAYGEKITLRNYNGKVSRCALKSSGGPFVVETWFGQGSADFRIASLHSFQLSMPERALRTIPRVRFSL